MLDEFFVRAAAHGFSGAVLVARGETVLLRNGYGFADRRKGTPATADTVFAIASLDKQFIAAAILRLEEMGKLKTSDPLSRFFDFAPPDKAGITLHQVLTHTSGLRNEYWDSHPGMSREQFVRFILCEQKLLAPPGRRWEYSNSGFWMLEEVVARASGMAFEDFLEDALFKPAGMGHTGMPSRRWAPGEVARYQFWTADFPREDFLRQPRPWWQILSTVDDLYRWYRALRDGRVLSAASQKKLFTPVLENYACGWNVVPTSRGTTLRHHGGSGNQGMLASCRWFVEEDVFVCVLSNAMNPSLAADYFCGDVEQILFGGRPVVPPALAPATPADKAVEGDYEFPGGGRLRVVRVPGGPLVARTTDPRVILLLRFPGSAAPPGRLPQDEQAVRAVRGIFAGDFEPLRAAMGNPKSFDSFRPRVQGLAAQMTSRLGPLREVSTVYQRAFEFEGVPEMLSFLRLRFERGDAVLRCVRPPSGAISLNPVRMPEALELPLAPRLGGGYSTWDFTLGTGATLAFEPGAAGAPARLRVGGGLGSTTATRRDS
jgi:CubicO group peptidase (beta-lactamase class C family)